VAFSPTIGRTLTDVRLPPAESRGQGDQIGRIFDYLCDCLGTFGVFLMIRASRIFRATVKVTDFLTINGLGYVLGDFYLQSHLVTLSEAKIFPIF
jgi:hypothetical protein